MAIHTFSVDFSSVVDTGSSCSSPTVTFTLPQNIALVCDNGDSIDIQINDDVAGPYCISFVIDCSSSCSTCGSIVVTKCFCVNPDDCENCSNCEGNVCVSRCAEGQVCDGDTCGECSDSVPCLCNQVCTQGVCRCPAGQKKRADGCCVECFDGEDLGNCRICIGGEIVAVDCPTGHCNQNTGTCQECLNNAHCLAANTCCNEHGICDCCPGYVLDPDSGECVPQPPCNNAQDCIDQFGPCYYCTVNGCAPKVCPSGFVCDPTTGECVPQCGNCPDGSGCINGMCIPCSQLSCLGVGLLCQFAEGCECNGTSCEYVNCNPDTVDLEWSVTTGTQGTIITPGQPSLAGTTSIVPLSMVYLQPPTGSGYYNHQFNLAITNGTSGVWTLLHSTGVTQGLGSGTSVSFDLTSTGPDMVGFVVKFVETGTGRTATWGIYRTPGSPFDQPNVWNYVFQSTGTPPITSGGTSGSVKLCSTNGNFHPTGVTNVQTTGTLVISFVSDGSTCLIASIVGCGTWNGDVILSCGGTTITVPAPEFTRDPANCCDPTDPNCDGWSAGDPCNGITIQNITLLATPTYGQAPNGDGEFFVEADFPSAGLSFFDWFYLQVTAGCWSTANNPASSSNDIQIVNSSGQSPFGPSVSDNAVFVTLGDGGCVRLGYTCELRVSGCKKLQGEICLTECQAFSVNIIDLGGNMYKAVPSLNDEVVTYLWSVIGGGVITNPTGQTITLAPAGGTTTLVVTAKYGSPVKCTASDSLILNTTIPGCTNPSACNYNSAANVDDNSCVLIGNPSYDCVLGGFQPGLISGLPETMPLISWRISGTPVPTNGQLTAGTYTVDLYFNGVQKCSRALVVPQCYRCSSGNCVAAPMGANSGLYTTSNCDNRCSCLIDIQVIQVATSGSRRSLIISATGDTGSYTVSVAPYLALNVLGPNVLAPISMTDSGSVNTGLLCPGQYRVTVVGANCTATKDVNIPTSCVGISTALSNIVFDCDTNQLFFDITPDACATSYTVQLLNAGLSVIATSTYPNITTVQSRVLAVGAYPGDGNYTVKVTAGGCSLSYPLNLDCLVPNDCTISNTTLVGIDDGINVSFTTTFDLSVGGGSYTVSLYNTTGGAGPTCAGASIDLSGVISSTTQLGALGLNTHSWSNVIATPGIPTCYGVRITRGSDPSCFEDAFFAVRPGEASPSCSIEITNVSYDTSTGNVIVSWDGTSTSNDLTVQINVSATDVCGGGDPLVIDEDGRGEDGVNIPFAIPQVQGQDQCITINIFDTNDPSCAADTVEYTIIGCTCSVTIVTDTIVVDTVGETVEFDVITTCTSGLVDIDISGDATGSTTIPTASDDGVSVTTPVPPISLAGYPSTGGVITIEATDDTDVGCIDDQLVVLLANCVACDQLTTLYLNDAVLTEIRDSANNLIVTGTYDVTADDADLEADTEGGVVSNGGNFCLTGTPVQVANSRNAGIKVSQDDGTFIILNYAKVTHADWASTRKFYFGDCGCGTRVCDYEYVLDIGASDDLVTFYYGVSSFGADFTGSITWAGMTQTPSGSFLAGIRADIIDALTNLSGCSYALDDVVVTYDTGADQLTIDLSATNAAIGVLLAAETGSGISAVVEATQSGCV